MNTYTVPKAADVLGLPYQTVRSWDDRGFLPFAGFKRGGWTNLDSDGVYLLGFFAQLSSSGVPLAIAARAVDQLRAPILHAKSPWRFCVGRSGRFWAINCATPDHLFRAEDWNGVTWLTTAGKPAQPAVKAVVPVSLLVIDIAALRQSVLSACE